MPERATRILFPALVGLLPFEPAGELLGLGLLQWLFLALFLCSIPRIVDRGRQLLESRAFLAALVFLAVCAVSGAASGFEQNSARALVRIAAGISLFAISDVFSDRRTIARVWSVAGVAAAAYGIVDYLGFGLTPLFRDREFYVGTVQRLSGSFEYPTTAAAYFAMTLPIAWSSFRFPAARYAGVGLIWTALVLTFSRGGLVAAMVGLFAGGLIARRRSGERNDAQARLTRAPVWPAAAMGALIYLGLGVIEPFLVDRLNPVSGAEVMSARYEPRFNQLVVEPGAEYDVPVRVVNQGQGTWAADGPGKVVLSHYWYDVAAGRILTGESTESPLISDLAAGESAELPVRFRTPPAEGLYLLDLEMRHEAFGLFSAAGLYPGVVEVRVRPGAAVEFRQGDASRWHRLARNRVASLDASVSRPELWTAAAAIIAERPFLGVGPDNFRVSYGPVLGYARWDDRVRSNSLFLELASTVGLVGLMAFLAVIAMSRRRWAPAVSSIVVFLVHGLVDVFLMTTPIYFAFWILLGFGDENSV